MADSRELDRSWGRSLKTRVAGPFLFLPLWARLRKERRSPSSDGHFEQALGLGAGRNLLPQAPFAAASSYRTPRDHPPPRRTGGISALAPWLDPQGKVFSGDFPALPFRGDLTAWDHHFRPRRGKAGPSVLRGCTQEAERRVGCYAHAKLARLDQPGERRPCVECWQGLTGHAPQGLSFDRKVVPSSELSRINPGGFTSSPLADRGPRCSVACAECRPRRGPPP